MPVGTRVHDCVDKVKKEGRGVNPYAVCQAATHQNFHTGKPLKRLRKSLKAPKVKCGGLKNSCGCPTCRTK